MWDVVAVDDGNDDRCRLVGSLRREVTGGGGLGTFTNTRQKNFSENNLRPEYYNFFMPENRLEKVPHPLKLVGQNVQYRQ